MRELGEIPTTEAEGGDEAFAGALQRRRLAAGLTQEALAERAGLGVRTIQGLEGGAARPSRETLRRLVAALGLAGAARARFEAARRPAARPPRSPPLRLVPPPPLPRRSCRRGR